MLTVKASSPYRTVHRDRLALKRAGAMGNRPAVLEAAQARVAEAFASRRGALYAHLAGHVEREAEGRRRLRSDGAGNLESALSTLLDYVQPTGAVLAPEAGTWRRLSVERLGHRAYGLDRKAELNAERRFGRWLDYLEELGLVATAQMRRIAAGEIRSTASIKRCTSKLLKLLGIESSLRKLGEQQRREKAQAKLSDIRQAAAKRADRNAAPTPPAFVPTERAERTPEQVEAARVAMAAIAATLGLKRPG